MLKGDPTKNVFRQNHKNLLKKDEKKFPRSVKTGEMEIEERNVKKENSTVIKIFCP